MVRVVGSVFGAYVAFCELDFQRGDGLYETMHGRH